MWEDKITYWAWRGKAEDFKPPPTEKHLIYADADWPWCKTPHKICVAVEDIKDGVVVKKTLLGHK